MANDEERAAVEGHIAALETRVQSMRSDKKAARNYVIKTQVEGPALLSALPRWMNHEKAFAAA